MKNSLNAGLSVRRSFVIDKVWTTAKPLERLKAKAVKRSATIG
jgi:hypothetical protein